MIVTVSDAVLCYGGVPCMWDVNQVIITSFLLILSITKNKTRYNND